METQSQDPELLTAERAPRFRLNLMVALFSAAAVVLALVGADTVLITGAQRPAPRPTIQQIRLAGAAPVESVVYLSVSPGLKPGPDGKLHDAFSVTDFQAHVGQPVKLVINNTDTVAHSINAPGAGVDIVVRPGTHSYTLLVRHPGRFAWFCMMPCDPFSMSHLGYMRGEITAT